jgi:hypothetical protein
MKELLSNENLSGKYNGQSSIWLSLIQKFEMPRYNQSLSTRIQVRVIRGDLAGCWVIRWFEVSKTLTKWLLYTVRSIQAVR